jgi:hypothetical protein
MWISGEWELRKKEFYAPGMLRIAPHGQPRDQRCEIVDSQHHHRADTERRDVWSLLDGVAVIEHGRSLA